MKLKSVVHKNLLFVPVVKFPPAFMFLVFIVLFLGVSLLLKGLWFGVFLLLPALFFLFYNEGVVFDLVKHNISNYSSVGSFKKVYRTRSLKNFKYLSIVRVGVLQYTNFMTQSNVSASVKYKLTMIKNGKTYFKVTTDEYYKVFSLGKKLAVHFNLGLVDYSKGQANWVIPVSERGEI